MQNTEFVDEIWFPSNACKREWSVFLQLEKTKTLITPSPVVISASCKTEPKLKSKNKIHIVLFDSPERYRRLAIVEEALEHTGRNLHVDFVGTSKPVSIYTPAPSVSVTYHGRVSHNEAMKILERSDIYMSAALMATQNRAMCEAMCMRKGLLVTSIPAHLEYIQKARYERALTFSPLERLNLSELVEGVQRLPVFEQTPRLDIFSRQRFRSFVKARLKGPSLNT